MSGRAKMFHMAPTTFHGMSNGSAMKTRQTDTQGPRRGIASAMASPRGIWIARTSPVNKSCLSRAAWNRAECSTCSNHRIPAQKKTLSPKLS